MSSPILDISHVAASQNDKETTINDAVDKLEAASGDVLSKDFTSGNVTLTDSEYRQYALFRSSNLSTARTLTVSAIKRIVVIDNSAGTATLTVALGSGSVEVREAEIRMIATDGTTNGIQAIASEPFDLAAFIEGKPAASQLVLQYVFVRAARLASGAPGSQGYAGVDPASDADFDLQKNGSSVGTMTFATASQTASFTVSSDVDFSAGDRLQIVAPSSQDADLQDMSATLKLSLL